MTNYNALAHKALEDDNPAVAQVYAMLWLAERLGPISAAVEELRDSLCNVTYDVRIKQ